MGLVSLGVFGEADAFTPPSLLSSRRTGRMKSGGRTELEAETEDVKTRLHLTPSLSEDHPLPYPLSIWLRPTSLPPSCRTATRTAPSTHKTWFWWVRDICLTLVLFMGLDYLYFKECSLEREREREKYRLFSSCAEEGRSDLRIPRNIPPLPPHPQHPIPGRTSREEDRGPSCK